MIDFRFALNFCACELTADAAAMAFSEAASDTDFNCFDRLDEWCSDVDDVKFLTNVDASSLDGVSPVSNGTKSNEKHCIKIIIIFKKKREENYAGEN